MDRGGEEIASSGVSLRASGNLPLFSYCYGVIQSMARAISASWWEYEMEFEMAHNP